MIDEKTAELLVERLIRRIEQANTYFLMKIGASVGKIRELTPSQAQQLVQILKYGGNYDKIVKEIAKYTNMNIKDIDDIFSTYAKKDQLFYEKFYKYKGKKFVPFDENKALKRQTQALANIVKNEMYDFTRSNVLGYTIRDLKGNPQFIGLKETYNRVLDEALLNVGQGKETFDSAMTRILKDIGGSGLKTLEYESGRSVRLDSAVRMHLKSKLRELHNENQRIFGQEFGADGIEISVHENPAPDHEKVQGRQFSYKEYEKLQNGEEAKDYKGNTYTLDHDGKNGYRPISELNCYHYEFDIILGVSKPEYTDKQLKQIIDNNEKGFEFEGKHYTNYEGTQLQRMLERKIREQKDTQILAKASGNEFLVGESQNKIRIFTNKYKELSDASGLPTKAKRMKVSAYRRSASATKTYNDTINKMKVGEFDITKYTNEIKPTTKDVILTPKQDYHIKKDHQEVMPYYDKLSDIINNPDNVYMELGKNKNTIWVTKEIDGHNIKATIRINTSTLYQNKTAGYKNSVIQMQPLPKDRIEKRIKKGEIKELFDLSNKK